jgi:N-acetyl-anhydromuramyl-L-alanine amidase AmpD
MSYKLIDATNAWNQSHMSAGREGNKVTKIVIHGLATTNFDMFPGGWNDRQASAHYIVGNGVVKQAVKDENTAWHSGDWPTNLTSIGVEHLNSTVNPYAFSAETLKTGAELVAGLLKKYGLGIDALHKHNEFSATACPAGLDWDGYKALVAKAMGTAVTPTPTPVTPTPAPKPTKQSDVSYMRQFGYVIMNGKHWKIDEIKDGLAISHELAGRAPYTSELNGVSVSGAEIRQGWFKFEFDKLDIIGYDEGSNGLKINYWPGHPQYYVWIDATAAKNA